MLHKLINFELRFHFKQTSYLLFTVLFFFSGIYFASQEGAIRPENKYNIHLFSSLISLAAVFQIVFQAAYTILRDRTNNVEQIIHTTAVGKFNFLMSRFLGIFLSSSFSTLLYVLALYTTVKLNFFGLHDGVETRLIDFIWPWLIIVLPNVFVLTGLLFTVASLTKKTPYIFFTGLLIFVLFWINNLYIGSPFTGGKLVAPQDALHRAAILDVLGLCTSYEQTQFWTPLEKGSQLVSFSGNILLNRIIWISFTLLNLFIVYTSFSFRLPEKRRTFSVTKWLKLTRKKKELDGIPLKHTYTPVFTIKKSFGSRLNELLTLIKIDFKSSIYSKTFLLLSIAWIVMLVAAILHNVGGQDVYGNVLPTSGLIVGLILEPLSQIGIFLIVFYAGELIWKSRQHRFNEILDATPANNTILLVSKYSALFLLPIFITVIGILVGLLFQLANGNVIIDYGLYLKVFYYGGTSLFIYGIISIFIQQLVSNKYVGMLLSLMTIYGLGYVLPSFGVEHVLGSLFKLPNIGEGYSEFDGFGQLANAFNWMSFFWVSVTLILLLLSFKIYKRNAEHRLKDQIKLAANGWKAPQRIVLGILLCFIGVSATVIDRKSKENTAYTGGTTDMLFRENYEKTFLRYKDKPIPVITDVKTRIELYPHELAYQAKGEYTLRNETQEHIDTLVITGSLRFKKLLITGAKLIHIDTTSLDARLFVLDPPLEPESSRMIQFTTGKKVGSFESQRDIVSNGTYLQNSSFEPKIGYQKALEITGDAERIKRGLPKASTKEEIGAYTFEDTTRPKQTFETWITTHKDHIAIAPGNLLNKKIANDRATFHYKSEVKTDNNISYFSSRYEVTKEVYKGTSIEVYHLPEHGGNVPDIIEAAIATLEYGQANFGAYPFDHLRIAEVPLHWKFGGHALPGTIAFQERFFTQDLSNPTKGINQLSRVVIHEIAHQWFGHKLSPAPGKGASMLSETLANYIEAQVLEKLYGKTMVRRLANFSRRRYFNFRSSAEHKEPSLHLVNNETYVSYRKGFLSMQATKELIGETSLNLVLKKLINGHVEEQSARSIDLVSMLMDGIEGDQQALISDWFTKIITYDLAIEDVNHVKTTDGRYRISITVEAKRFENSADGLENEVNMDEEITIGLYDAYPDDPKANVRIEKIRLKQGINSIDLETDQLPKYVVIDPMVTRPDEDVVDNLFEIENE